MDAPIIEEAFRALGDALNADVELLLVGGAAGMVTGVLPASRTTIDCDVARYIPADAGATVEMAAEVVGRDLGLPDRWLNSDVQIRLDALPDEWEGRKVFVGAWGRLRVFAVSRIDLIAMKVLAGRAQDLEDIEVLRLRSDDVAFVRRYLKSLGAKGTDRDEIAAAEALLDSVRIHTDE